ncbi:MAG: bifunctional ADP-dependent NAD(P)H-hydrate dehydratase/NAD(P)H-hydrate epimerase, partial [Candidatus Dadabacteria bacterium]
MIPLFSGDSVARIDQATIGRVGIPGRVLMEQAGRAVAESIRRRWPERPVRVFAGKGNNGGDGYVAARWLQHFGQPVQVLALAPTESLAG